jgi:hypothetical protein
MLFNGNRSSAIKTGGEGFNVRKACLPKRFAMKSSKKWVTTVVREYLFKYSYSFFH